MVTSGGPDIVNDGLVLHLDAADRKSYSGSGNSWSDLSLQNGAVTKNGPIYTDINRGVFLFDGTDDYFETNIPTGSYDTNGNSFFAWVYTTDYNRQKIWSWYSLTRAGGGYPDRGDFELQNTSNHLKFQAYGRTTNNDTGFAITTNKWWYVGFVWNPGQTVTIYVNGDIKFHGSQSLPSQNDGGNFRIGWRPYQNEKPWQGYMSQISLYDGLLSAEQVQQNYNATKGRYGL